MMFCRCDEEGYLELAKPDGRRGLWMRETLQTLELCAGREGDDDYVKLVVGDRLTLETLHRLQGAMLTLRWAYEVAADNTEFRYDLIFARLKNTVVKLCRERDQSAPRKASAVLRAALEAVVTCAEDGCFGDELEQCDAGCRCVVCTCREALKVSDDS